VARLTLLFAILSLVFQVALIVLRAPFPAYPLTSWQDAIDLLSPLVLIPLYWVMYRRGSRRAAEEPSDLPFLIFATIWAVGHGIHLASNSIHNLADAEALGRELDIRGSDLYRLIYFLDERLGHTAWYLGILGLAAVLMWREARSPAGIATVWWAAVVAGVIYGFTCFCIFVEGQAVPLGLPFAAIVTAYALRVRRTLPQRPLAAFFGIAFLVALLLFAVWGIRWHGFPQFSDVGLI